MNKTVKQQDFQLIWGFYKWRKVEVVSGQECVLVDELESPVLFSEDGEALLDSQEMDSNYKPFCKAYNEYKINP